MCTAAVDGTLAANNQAATEVGGGFYRYDLSSAALDDYLGKFKTSDTTVDAAQVAGMVSLEIQHIDADISSAKTLTAAYDAAKTAASASAVASIPTNPLLTNDARIPATVIAAKADVDAVASEVWGAGSRTLTGQSSRVTVTGPVLTSGGISIVPGDDYYAADGRQLEWSSTEWPDITGSVVTFYGRQLEKACSIIASGAGVEQTVRLELSNSDTKVLVDNFDFKIKAKLDDSDHIVTLVDAAVNVK